MQGTHSERQKKTSADSGICQMIKLPLFTQSGHIRTRTGKSNAREVNEDDGMTCFYFAYVQQVFMAFVILTFTSESCEIKDNLPL